MATKKKAAAGIFAVGRKYLFRTVTYHMVGEIAGREGDFLILKNASWVADSGRFGEAAAKGTLVEVEHLGGLTVLINAQSLTDAVEWKHPLPEKSI